MKTNVSMMKKNAQSGKKSKSVQRKKSEAAGYVTPIIGLGTVAENYLKQFVQMDGKIGEMQSDFAVSLKSGESALKSKISSENSAVSELRKSNGANIKTLRTKLTDKINKIDCNKIYEINKVQRDLEKELDAIKLEFANLNAKHKEITEEYNKLVAEIDSKNSEEMRGAEIKLCEKEEATQNGLKNIESTLEKAKNSYESAFEKQNTTLREQILDLQSKYFVNIKTESRRLQKKFQQ